MARTTLSPLAAEAQSVPAAAAFTWTACDVSNGNAFLLSNLKNVILLHNTNSGSTAHTFTITSAQGGTIKHTLAAGTYYRICPIPTTGYAQGTDSGNIWINGDHAEIEIAVVNIP